MLKRFYNHLSVISDDNIRILKWSNSKTTKKNIGDVLNTYLFQMLFHKETINISKVLNIGFPPVYSFIGSVLDNSSVKNLIIIGSGFKSEFSKVSILPKQVVATRGPLTRNKLLGLGLKVPQVYGDPAILLPRFYNTDVDIKYKIGIIPHYVDRNLEIVKIWSERSDVKIIDVFSDMEQFIKDIKSCEFTVSSSLHGVILSHSYGIPSVWIKLSNKVVGKGFKFYDYFQSVNIDTEPLILETNTTINKLISKSTLPDIAFLESKLFEELNNFKI